MLPRFYCPHLVESGTVTLTDSEAHHLIHVLRREVSDDVELFSGNGLVATCRITSIRKRDLELAVMTVRRDEPLNVSLTLATAVPKGDRFDWLIEKATELGVARLVPLTTLRSVVDPRESKLDKLRQTVISACKQSGRNHLMHVAPVTSWNEFLNATKSSCPFFIAHPNGEPSNITSTLLAEQRALAIAVGPEGGFSDDEVQAAISSGAKRISLGRQILRIETAAIALAAKILV